MFRVQLSDRGNGTDREAYLPNSPLKNISMSTMLDDFYYDSYIIKKLIILPLTELKILLT